MRILKEKILKAHIAAKEAELSKAPKEENEVAEPEPFIPRRSERTTINKSHKLKATSEYKLSPFNIKSTKNIIKNYGRAICNFVALPVARDYLDNIIKKQNEDVSIEEFIEFAQENKGKVDSMEGFKSILIIKRADSPKMCSFKRIFKSIGEIFIKYFSVNWVFESRVTYKQAHLGFRFKMLRRLRKPELFNNLKSSLKW